MLKFTVKEDFRTFKKGQVLDIDLDTIKYLSFVGDNGCGKTTLMQALRGKFLKPREINLRAADLKKWDWVSIETSYKRCHFLDIDFDDPTDMNNCYDACSYYDMNNFQYRDLSHGQRTLQILIHFVDKCKDCEDRELIVFDEIDSGLDLRFQTNFMNLVRKLSKSYDVIIITHNPLIIFNSYIVYDLERALKNQNPILSSKNYLEEKTYLTIDYKKFDPIKEKSIDKSVTDKEITTE